jgi:DUF1365 family protein
MAGRRRHPRYVMSNSEGTLQVVTDVSVHRDAQGDLTAITDRPLPRGEVLTLEVMNGAFVRTPVHVAEVRPIIVSGSIRHWLRLVPIEKDTAAKSSSEGR